MSQCWFVPCKWPAVKNDRVNGLGLCDKWPVYTLTTSSAVLDLSDIFVQGADLITH
jgi:hypothetical protein